jgi:hypothetical protein
MKLALLRLAIGIDFKGIGKEAVGEISSVVKNLDCWSGGWLRFGTLFGSPVFLHH